ncbi:YolD-like family protein [Paenibacillus sp. PK3_47]|uniref:YolD-like family protein n=1 Tax=Paenibacillus sp. PK3_47 TaxID=2072642 RepID=UPI00201DCD5A|nr:YolD-like family protein [Paenibacillus sp. PK3_47]UQZ32840.1 YolD-like family protein [Paenibacillus sp. PK3_47]
MGKKLNGSGLRESGRMMIPEHNSLMIQDKKETWRRVRPVLDEEKLEEIECTLGLSLRAHVRVTVIISGPFENKQLSGFVTSIHTHTREFKLQWAEEWKWINVDDIADAYIV